MSGYAPINELLTVTASAGSGKTYRIAKEYIKWCLSESPDQRLYRKILAVTFTNKATAEMKERILHALKSMATGQYEKSNDQDFAEEVRKDLALSETELKGRAKAVLHQILHDYNNLSITTIDSFSYRLVSTFAHDLELPANFEVELNFGNVLNTGIDLLIEKAGLQGEENLTEVLLNYVAFQLDEEEKGLQVKKKMIHAGKALEHMGTPEGLLMDKDTSLELLLEKFRALHRELSIFRRSIREKAVQFFNFMKEKGIDPDLSNRFVLWKYKKLLTIHDLKELEELNSAILISILEGAPFYPKSKEKMASASYDKWDKELRTFLADFDDFLQTYYKRMGLTELVVKNYYPTILLGSLALEIETLKKNDRVLHISEFNKYIQEVVKEPTPFIYERLGERFRAFLLDEFQDTSAIQWNNIKPLIENALSQEEKNKVFVVGDAKQSIYNWRGAEVKLILELMKERTSGAYAIRTEQLGKNYRSLPSVVDFHKDLFFFIAQNMQDPQHADLFLKGAQEANKKSPAGYVRLAPDKEKDQTEALKEITDALNRGYNPGDIAVLVRNNGDAKKLQKLMQKNGIAFSAGKSMLMDEDPYVMATICLLQLINGNQTDVALSRISSTILGDEQKQRFSESLHHAATSFLNMEGSKVEFQNFLTKHFSLNQVSQNGLYEAAIQIHRNFIDEPSVSAAHQSWLTLLRNFEHTQSNSVEAFLRHYWEDKEKRQYNGETAEDKVMIETIHSSKGLQYPVVIVPKADWSLKPVHRDIISLDLPNRFAPLRQVRTHYQKEIGEFEEMHSVDQSLHASAQLAAVNLLYVALTRAENELYVFYPTRQNNHEEAGSVNHLLQSYCDMHGGEIIRGEKLIRERKEKPSAEVMPKFSNQGWKDRIFVSWKATKSLQEEGINAREWGKLVHGILAKAEKVEEAKELISQLYTDGVLNDNDAKMLEESVCSFMEHPAFRPFWEMPGRRFSEREFVSEKKKILRPDKVVEHEGSYTIIDFKTGEKNEKHKAQMDEYGTALEKMSSKPVHKVLMYLRKFEVLDWY